MATLPASLLPPSSPPSSLRVGRLITYTVAGAGLVLGGSIVYANYDPVFKNRLDQYIPGFGSLADSAADMYVGVVDSVGLGRKRGDHEEGKKVGLGLEKKDVHLGTVFGEGRKGKTKDKVPASPPVERKTEQQEVAPPKREEIAPTPAHGGTSGVVAAEEGKEEGKENEAQEQAEEITPQPSPAVPSPPPPPPPPPSSSSHSLTAEGEQAEEEKASKVVVKEEEASEEHQQKKEEVEEKEKEEGKAQQEVKVEEVERNSVHTS